MNDELPAATPPTAHDAASDVDSEVSAHEAAELATQETVEVDGEESVEVDGEEILDAEIVPTAAQVSSRVPADPGASITGVPAPAFDYTDSGVPTLGYVRDRIEKRWGTAQGSAELAGETETAEQQQKRDEDRAALAAEKLAEIRRGLTP